MSQINLCSVQNVSIGRKLVHLSPKTLETLQVLERHALSQTLIRVLRPGKFVEGKWTAVNCGVLTKELNERMVMLRFRKEQPQTPYTFGSSEARHHR